MSLRGVATPKQSLTCECDCFVLKDASRSGRRPPRNTCTHRQVRCDCHCRGACRRTYLLNNPGGSSGRPPTVPVVARSGDRPQQVRPRKIERILRPLLVIFAGWAIMEPQPVRHPPDVHAGTDLLPAGPATRCWRTSQVRRPGHWHASERAAGSASGVQQVNFSLCENGRLSH